MAIHRKGLCRKHFDAVSLFSAFPRMSPRTTACPTTNQKVGCSNHPGRTREFAHLVEARVFPVSHNGTLVSHQPRTRGEW
jgi:hypothetical protein